jgi:hypothetical protein
MNEIEDRVDLKAMDPGSKDPGFWIRFHGKVMSQAREGLARRKMTAEWTIPEVVFQWRRTLVPLTLLAATLAGIFAMGHEEPTATAPVLALEEALTDDLGGEPIPTILGRTVELDEVAFLTAAGGF